MPKKRVPHVEPSTDSPAAAVLDVVADAEAGDLIVTERGNRDSSLGRVLQLKIFRPGYTPLTWGEVWKRFSEAYPGKWAVQVFPPADQLVDGKDVYHLFVCDVAPAGLNIREAD